MNRITRSLALPLWLLLGLFCSTLVIEAGTYYWLGNGISGSRQFSDSSVWTDAPSGGAGGIVLTNTATDNDLVFGNYQLFQNTLNARPKTVSPYQVRTMTFTCNGWLISSTLVGDKIILGSGGIVNNLSSVGGTPTSGAVPAQNEFRALIDLTNNCTINNGDLTFQLAIRHDAAHLTGGIKHCLDLKNYTLTFDGAGTNSFATPTAGQHAGGAITGTGNIIKNGTGQTSFNATNTYTGWTLVNAGRLLVRTIASGGGAYTNMDGASLAVTVNAAGTFLQTASLCLGSAVSNNFQVGFGSLGNPTVNVVYATNLTLNGTTYVSITGSGLSVGTATLIKYPGTIIGTGTVTNGVIPDGVVGYITNNVAAKEIQFVITKIPNLLWTGVTNAVTIGNWDINGTSNWVDTTSGNAPDYYFNALPVRFTDTAATGLVALQTNVVPFQITVSNNALAYTFTNDGVNGFTVNPSQGIIKDGPGLLTIGMTNAYTSSTTIRQGTIQVTAINAIGRGIGQSGAALTNNGVLDLNGLDQNIGILVGSGVITNTSANPAILQAQAGGTDGGSFSGRIDEGSGGAIRFNRSGGTLLMSGANRYSGGTYIVTGGAAAGRQITLGGNDVLGTGPLTFTINGILSADGAPRTLTNAVNIQSTTASIQLGSAGAALLTLSGPYNINSSADQSIVCSNDVVLSGPMTSTSGGFNNKDGAGKLTFKNNTVNSVGISGDASVRQGSMIIDGATFAMSGPDNVTILNFRVQSLVTNSIGYLLITNSGSLTVGNASFGYGDLRLGDTASPTNNAGQITTNIVDVSGSLTADDVIMGYSNTNNAGGGKLARLNLNSGSQITVNQFSAPSTNCRANTEINLDGTTIIVRDDPSSSFLEGMTNVFVKSGGVTLNGANTNSIHIRQNLLTGGGSGGLTWNGTNTVVPVATMLQLDGTNTYTGTTLIKVGNLGGIGRLTGPLVMASGSGLYPGGGGSIGTFTVNNSVTLSNGVRCSFELNTTNSLSAATNDMLVVSGALSITNVSLTVGNNGPALTNGNYFKLFSQPVALASFSSINLPALDPSLAWQTNLAVDGSISVGLVVVTPPTLGVSQSGSVLTFTWSGGGFKLQSQTNTLAIGLVTNSASWFDYPGGTVSGVTSTINPANPTVFYRLSQ